MLESKLCFEDLSNEIYMEIFDYLYGQHIVSAFFSLNHRFNLLCIHYSNYHINASDYRLFFNRKHIRSLKFETERWIPYISVKYLFSLCSITFTYILHPTKIIEFLEKLPSPHYLHRLTIDLNRCQDDIQHLISTIFKLPNLIRLEWDSYFIKQDFGIINHSLLSLRHLSISCYERKQFLKLVSFIPNLISLNLLYQFDSRCSDLIFVKSNSLSKLKSLQINNIRRYDEIYSIFQLCPQVKRCKMQCNPTYGPNSIFKAKNWEELLSSMVFLEKLNINIDYIRDKNVIDLSEYQTNFWIQRNLKAIIDDDPRPYSTSFCIKSVC